MPLKAVRLHQPFPIKPGFTQAQLDAAEQAGYLRGCEETRAALEALVQEQQVTIATHIERALKSLGDSHAELVSKAVAALPDVALEIARRVLAGVEPSRERVIAVIDELLADIPKGTEGVEVILHPADLAVLGLNERGMNERYPDLRFTADESLTPGDCKMLSSFGIVDARVEVKLANIANSLK